MTARELKTVLARISTWPKGAQDEAIKALREIEEDFIIGPHEQNLTVRTRKRSAEKGYRLRRKRSDSACNHYMLVHFTETADEQLDRLPKRLQIRIVEKVEVYAQQPDACQFSESLTGSNEYRFRVGDYRVMFEVMIDMLFITAIKRRDEAYR